MEQFILRQVGSIQVDEEGMRIVLDRRYLSALEGIDGFSHINILWWFSGCDNDKDRRRLVEPSPYKNAPAKLGTFATRSPMRPNPVALSCAGITYIDWENAVIGLDYIDADNGSPVMDIKPYTPSLDRVEAPSVPGWCTHWPKSLEKSGEFDWESEFNF